LPSHKHIDIESNIPTQKVASLYHHMMVKVSIYVKQITMKNCLF